MTDWLRHSKKPTKYYGRLTKTLQALEDMWNSGPSLLEHQNWSTWWKNTSRRAKYAQRDFEAEKDFWLFDFLTKKAHLNMILDPPKRYRLLRTCFGGSRIIFRGLFWVKKLKSRKSFSASKSRWAYFALRAVFFHQIDQFWCSKKLEPEFYMSSRACNILVSLS